MVITRLSERTYSVVTNTVLADGSFRADYAMSLERNVLCSIGEPGHIRIGGLMRVTLGPVSLAAVLNLKIGESFEVKK